MAAEPEGIGMEGVQNEVHDRGFVFIPSLRPHQPAGDVVSLIGETLSLRGGDPVHMLSPALKDAAAPNTYSGLYGLNDFPFHSDMAHWRVPPRYLMLRCVLGFKEVPTLLVNGAYLAKSVGLELLGRAIVRPRRPVQGKIPLLRLYQPFQGSAIIRWDEVFIQPASSAGEDGVARFKAALRLHRPEAVPLANAGDTLVIDNWRMLHARAFVPSNCMGRKLERAYLERLH